MTEQASRSPATDSTDATDATDATDSTHATDSTASLGGAGFITLLGLRLDEIGPDRVIITWDVTPALHQPYGLVHGGVHAAVVETAGSLGAGAWMGDRGQVVGVSNQTDFLRAVRTGTLRAVGEPIHRGRLQQLWLVEIRDEDERLVARGQVRLQNIPDAGRLAEAPEAGRGG